MRGVFADANGINLMLIIFPRMSLLCKLTPVQYREYENGLLNIGSIHFVLGYVVFVCHVACWILLNFTINCKRSII